MRKTAEQDLAFEALSHVKEACIQDGKFLK